ncbi:MAG TPA: hypothetical protein PLB89_05350 [Flavobacteriales bacterium]|nr:hypothetical protein [Flavobacteriales bacterium]
MPLKPHSSVRISSSLFEELVRTGMAVSEAEHLATLAGKEGTVEGSHEDRNDVAWCLVLFSEYPEAFWLPQVACIPLNGTNLNND